MVFRMSDNTSKRLAAILAVVAIGTLGLTGCVGGTTYGTDKAQEAQTLDAVYNIFSIAPPKQEKIDYSSRPDLVIPENKQQLPQPLEQDATAQHPAWPESPEAKRARLRAKADANGGEEAITDDDGTRLIAIENRKTDKDHFRCLDKVCDQNSAAKQAEIRKRVLAAKAQTEYSKVGAQRKYLTEPPNIYRSRSGNTSVDDYGLSPEQEKARREAEEAEARELKGRGVAPKM